MSKNFKLPNTLPIFPLSNFIYFPNTSAPLNIFEPRYIQMIDESMKTNRMIGMAQPRGTSVKEKPDLFKVGCLGKISSFNETEDGRYVIVLNGVSRFNIVEEIDNKKTFREFKINFEGFESDIDGKEVDINFSDLNMIFNNLKKIFEKQGYLINWKALEKQSLDETINALAMASPFTLEEKQILLEAPNLDLRKNKISEILKTYSFDLYENSTLQ